jgi:hypothetical protein
MKERKAYLLRINYYILNLFHFPNIYIYEKFREDKENTFRTSKSYKNQL